MKYLTYLLTIAVFLLYSDLQAQQMVEGLHYQTGKPVRVTIQDGVIIKLESVSRLTNPEHIVWLAPGLIDNQVNGFAGVSFAFGDSDLTEAGVRHATQELWKKGVTTYLPTLTTNSQEILTKNFRILAKASEHPHLLGSIPGFHLEGPYINPEDGYRGAHPRQYVRLPDWTEFMEYYNASDQKILQITIAPELQGAQGFIQKCREMGIIVAAGHHNASTEELNKAVENGVRIATHLGNGCANMINRHRNPLWPQLANDNLMISIICDGFHLLPEEIKVFYSVKGPDKTIITSDVTHYAALQPGQYTTQTGETIELTPAGKLILPEQNVLYGSASPITKGVGHMMAVTGCSLSEAIQMASTNPARLYNLNDRGELQPGKRADLILFTIENHVVDIEKTYVSGKLVFSKE